MALGIVWVRGQVLIMTRHLIPSLFFSFLLLSGTQADASIVMQLSQTAMVRHSNLIVTGTITKRSARYVGKRNKHIVTDVQVNVSRFLKGRTATRTLKVRRMGGKIGNINTHVHSENSFRVGERVLLYLVAARPTPFDKAPDYYYVTSMSHGRYTIKHDPHTKQVVLLRPQDRPTQLTRTAKGTWSFKEVNASPAPILMSTYLKTLQTTIKTLQARRLSKTSRTQTRVKKTPLLPHTKR
ncbi:MAG TPA: hypothetical protein DCE42_22905 [Myxococcales bacterium]|nr:hypothetical protein [Deltaproteobacteria bacterium]HAA57635.1 hypothetical protein [Myxococcales bacterium]